MSLPLDTIYIICSYLTNDGLSLISQCSKDLHEISDKFFIINQYNIHTILWKCNIVSVEKLLRKRIEWNILDSDIKRSCTVIENKDTFNIILHNIKLDIQDIPLKPEFIRMYREMYPEAIVNGHLFSKGSNATLELCKFKNIAFKAHDVRNIHWKNTLIILENIEFTSKERSDIITELTKLYEPECTRHLIRSGLLDTSNLKETDMIIRFNPHIKDLFNRSIKR